MYKTFSGLFCYLLTDMHIFRELKQSKGPCVHLNKNNKPFTLDILPSEAHIYL